SARYEVACVTSRAIGAAGCVLMASISRGQGQQRGSRVSIPQLCPETGPQSTVSSADRVKSAAAPPAPPEAASPRGPPGPSGCPRAAGAYTNRASLAEPTRRIDHGPPLADPGGPAGPGRPRGRRPAPPGPVPGQPALLPVPRQADDPADLRRA